ncbi:MAG TPA: hypothetical protein VGM82_06895 [Gemmatimonadaceae bacterium]|jgi:hypothetical protein
MTRSTVLALGLTTLVSSTSAAQFATDQHTRVNVPAGFETEQYLRALQVAGIVPQYPWTIRAFGVDELKTIAPAADSTHPWSNRLRPVAKRWDAYILAPRLQTVYNTTLPYGVNDGPMWAGRGLTTDVQFGFGAAAGPVSLIIAPEAFRAENRTFPLLPTGFPGNLTFATPYATQTIDVPQRFGNGAYQRLDLGQSTLRVAAGPIAVGASTSNEYWGPAIWNPVLLGNNAAGFPHLFAGTAHPIDLWIAKVHTRVIWGRLDQSDYSIVTGETRRFGTGVVGVLEPRGLPGLELGVSRFYHEVWPTGGPSSEDFRLALKLNPFAESRSNVSGLEVANQLASMFFRWNFPGTGFEAYGEFGRDDFANDIDDIIAEPDHISAYTVGLQRVLRCGARCLVALKAETMNSRMTRLALVRGQAPFYTHAPIAQGHTELGQVLGAPAGFGGAGTNVGVDVYRPDGQWSFLLSRQMVDQIQPPGSVWYGFTVQRMWTRRYADLRLAITQAVEMNRTPGQDIGNSNFQVGTLVHW